MQFVSRLDHYTRCQISLTSMGTLGTRLWILAAKKSRNLSETKTGTVKKGKHQEKHSSKQGMTHKQIKITFKHDFSYLNSIWTQPSYE